jgi:FkbM family methyltransferase
MSFSSLMSSLRAVIRPIAASRVHTIGGGLPAGLKRRGGSDYFPRKLTSEELFLQSLDLRGKTVYDVGTYIGLYTLFFARAVGEGGRVIGFEPHPENFNAVRTNVSLNEFRNVELFSIGVGGTKGTAVMVAGSDSGLSSIAESGKRLLEERGHTSRFTVEVDTLDNIIAQRHLPAPGLVKIDVEGLEFEVVSGMAKTMADSRPPLFIEIHCGGIVDKAPHVARLLRSLGERGYGIYHVETMSSVSADNPAAAIRGHIYAEPI